MSFPRPQNASSSTTWSVLTGAGSGFGRALALELARQGKGLILSDIHEDGLRETAEQARKCGALQVKEVICDVRQAEDIQKLIAACEGAPVELLINNAGVATAGLFEEISLEDWRWTLDIDLMGVILGCHAFLPLMKRQGYGRILNVASAAGLLSPPNLAAYNVAKAGVVALSESLAAELSCTPIRVTVACPTFFRTAIARSTRYTDPSLAGAAHQLIDRGPSAQVVAARTLRAVRKGKLYALPMLDGRAAWVFKRVAPAWWPHLIGWAVRISQNHFKGRP